MYGGGGIMGINNKFIHKLPKISILKDTKVNQFQNFFQIKILSYKIQRSNYY
jgi:hypothetical protein